jgi:hypothetical protein
MMNFMMQKKKIGVLMILTLITAVLAAVIFNSDLGSFIDILTQAIFTYSIGLLIVEIVLLFGSESIFNTWKKFALVYIPISFVLILLTGRGTGIMPIDSELVTWWTAGLFLIISLGIIIYKKLKPGY